MVGAVRLHMLVHRVDHMGMRFAQVLELYRMLGEYPRNDFKLPLTIQLCAAILVDQKGRRYQVPVNPATKGQLGAPYRFGRLRYGEAFNYARFAERVRVNLALPSPFGDEAWLRAETFSIRLRISSRFSFAFTDGGASS